MEKGKEDGSESALHLVIHLVLQSVHRVSSTLEVDEFLFQSSFVEGLAFKFENMAAAVVPSSRGSLEWAAQQDTQILTVDESKQVPIPLRSILKSTLHWQKFWKERCWTLCRTPHEAQVWKLRGNS